MTNKKKNLPSIRFLIDCFYFVATLSLNQLYSQIIRSSVEISLQPQMAFERTTFLPIRIRFQCELVIIDTNLSKANGYMFREKRRTKRVKPRAIL